MFSTKEIKDVVHNFPIRGRNGTNSVVADGLIPSESKDGFVQVEVVQEALKGAVEIDNKRLSISSFASTYDVNCNLILELLDRSYPDIVWSRNRDEVLSRSEQRHVKERLINCCLDQYVEVDKFLLKHDIHKSSLGEIHEPYLLIETIDYDGKKYLHSTQLTKKVTTYIRGRLSKAEQHQYITKLAPGDLPGHPPLWLISGIVKELSGDAGGNCKGVQEMEGSEVKYIPGSYKQKQLTMLLAEIKSGQKFYMETNYLVNLLFRINYSSDGIKVYGQYLVSSILLKQISSRLKTELIDVGYAHVPMSEGSQEISQGLHNIIILNLTEVYEQSNFKYNYPYVFSHYWLECTREELIRVVDVSLQTRWDSAPPLDPLDDLPNAAELTQSSVALDSMPIGLLNMLLFTDLRKVLKDRHATKLKGLQEEADHTFNAFWLRRVTVTIEAFAQALLKVEDEKLRNQLSVTLAVFIRTSLVPRAIMKAVTRRLVRRGNLAEELSKLQKDLEPYKAPPSSSFSSAEDSPPYNVFYVYLISSIYMVIDFSEQFNTPQVSYYTLYALEDLMRPSTSHSSSLSSFLSPSEPSAKSAEIPPTFLDTRKVVLFEDLRHGMVDEKDDARLFLKMLIILFARRHQVMIYATGKAAPKLMKDLLPSKEVGEEGDEEKKNEMEGEEQQQEQHQRQQQVQVQQEQNDDYDDTVTTVADGSTNEDPMIGVESTSTMPDTSIAHDHEIQETKQDADPNPPAGLGTASTTQQQSTNDEPLKGEEKFISFAPPQNPYSIPTSSEDNNNDDNDNNDNNNDNDKSENKILFPPLDIDIHSPDFEERMHDLKDRVKRQTITADDRRYMKTLAGVVDAQTGEVMLNGHWNEKGKWAKHKRNGASGGWKEEEEEEEEEEVQIKNWFRERFERGANLL